MIERRTILAAVALGIGSLALPACSGGGGGSSGGGGGIQIPAAPTNAPTVAPPTTLTAVTGSVVSLPQGTFGPTAGSSGLAGATVIIGSVLVPGATPPPSVPVGDVKTTSALSGVFSATVPVKPVPPSATTFVLPFHNVFGVANPTLGYFVNIFPTGADGKSVGAQLPVHAFVAVGPGGALGAFRSTTASTDEAGWLTQLNIDRAAKGLAPVVFDELIEEAAREEVSNLTTNLDDCHYDTQNRGPNTRYSLLGGLGANVEAIGIAGADSNLGTSAFWHQLEATFLAEGPGGYHYDDLLGAAAIWSGIAVGTGPFAAGGPNGLFYGGDVENVNIQSTVADVYDNSSCPAGITANDS